MDTKWKNNRKRMFVTILALLLLTLGTIAFFPEINYRGTENLEQMQTLGDASQEDTEFLKNIYQGCYLLYQEEAERDSGTIVKPSELFMDSYEETMDANQKALIDEAMEEIFSEWSAVFETYRANVDYCVIRKNGEPVSNNGKALEKILQSDSYLADIAGYYREIFSVSFDEKGVMKVEPYYTRVKGRDDGIIKTLSQVDRKNMLSEALSGYLGYEYEDVIFHVMKPKNFQVIFAVPVNGNETWAWDSDEYTFYWKKLQAYTAAGAKLVYGVAALILIAFAFFMQNPKIWKREEAARPWKKRRLLEAAVIAAVAVFCMQNTLVALIWNPGYESFSEIKNAIGGGAGYEVLISFLTYACVIFGVYAVWYASVYFLIPVFSFGPGEYIRTYSLIYQIFPWMKKRWKQLLSRMKKRWDQFLDEIHHMDFEEKYTKMIAKAVFLNFIILALLSLLWFWGIAALGIYSVALFYLLKKNYDKICKNYQTLLLGVRRIAEGDLNTVITEDMGIFEPFRNELVKIRTGFQKAVDEEVKSQRMKTELITNVSHDLKTPLTAITTYVELLKKEDITEEERHSYIDTLEKKAFRLKVLIEDLFEVSKASSNNLLLNPIELDVIHLIKQVNIEYVDKMKEKGLELRWNLPEEKVIVRLDNQKTYRIFENLFVNVLKYAMPNTRVYVDVKKSESAVQIAIKNMSAEELQIDTNEITERFVRGDRSRNTEGSGLGLAIAKSITEAQGGTFRIEIDGDLFKAVLSFPLA